MLHLLKGYPGNLADIGAANGIGMPSSNSKLGYFVYFCENPLRKDMHQSHPLQLWIK